MCQAGFGKKHFLHEKNCTKNGLENWFIAEIIFNNKKKFAYFVTQLEMHPLTSRTQKIEPSDLSLKPILCVI